LRSTAFPESVIFCFEVVKNALAGAQRGVGPKSLALISLGFAYFFNVFIEKKNICSISL
jgi:hypothetical protein